MDTTTTAETMACDGVGRFQTPTNPKVLQLRVFSTSSTWGKFLCAKFSFSSDDMTDLSSFYVSPTETRFFNHETKFVDLPTLRRRVGSQGIGMDERSTNTSKTPLSLCPRTKTTAPGILNYDPWVKGVTRL